MDNQPSFLKRGLKSVLSIFITQTKITKIDKITESFVMIELTGTKLKDGKWVPGGKVQISVGNLAFRTYTPISVDKKTGQLAIVCHRRAGSPATIWLDTLKVGDDCEVFGPRESLDFSSIDDEVALFGDETSFGLSKVLQNKAGKKAHLFFEANSSQDSAKVLGRIGVKDPRVMQRLSDDSHLQKIAREIIDLHSRKALSKFFLTGRASSIQKIRALLKDSGIPNSALKIRAYWADGKVGLD